MTSKYVLKDARLYAGAADLTGSGSKIELKCSCEDKDTTTYGSGGWKEALPGLAETMLESGGFFESGGTVAYQDDESWADLIGSMAIPWSVLPRQPAAATYGDLAYVAQGISTAYTIGDAVGEVAPWSATGKGSEVTARGSVLNPPGTARTATGSGTAVQIGALSASQALYVNLHLLSVSGTATPTITFTVQSDNASNFPSSTTQATFTAATAIGYQVKKISGAVTDDWWRVGYTISGTNPSFLALVTAGIGPI